MEWLKLFRKIRNISGFMTLGVLAIGVIIFGFFNWEKFYFIVGLLSFLGQLSLIIFLIFSIIILIFKANLIFKVKEQ